MKLKFMGYEVDVKAKHEFEDEPTIQVTGYFLNSLSIAFREAQRWCEFNGDYSSAISYYNAHQDIFEYLLSEGFYGTREDV